MVHIHRIPGRSHQPDAGRTEARWSHPVRWPVPAACTCCCLRLLETRMHSKALRPSLRQASGATVTSLYSLLGNTVQPMPIAYECLLGGPG